jgi:hypothetical protein
MRVKDKEANPFQIMARGHDRLTPKATARATMGTRKLRRIMLAFLRFLQTTNALAANAFERNFAAMWNRIDNEAIQ